MAGLTASRVLCSNLCIQIIPPRPIRRSLQSLPSISAGSTSSRFCAWLPPDVRVFDERQSNKRLKLTARRLWNESFFSAPQLKRHPLGQRDNPVVRRGSATTPPCLTRGHSTYDKCGGAVARGTGVLRSRLECGAGSECAGRTPRGRLLGRKYSVGGRGRVAGAVQRRRGRRSLGNTGRLGCFGNAFWLIQWPGRGALGHPGLVQRSPTSPYWSELGDLRSLAGRMEY